MRILCPKMRKVRNIKISLITQAFSSVFERGFFVYIILFLKYYLFVIQVVIKYYSI